MKIVHLSDLHVVAPPGRLYASDPRAELARVLAHVARHHGDAAFLWITGDLTQNGDEPAYLALHDLLTDCPVPAHLGLGNHDSRAAFRRVFQPFGGGADDPVQFAVETPAGVFLMLDTVVPGASAGCLDAARLDWLRTQLAAHADRDVFIGLHHPPHETGLAGMDRIRLNEGADALGDLLTAHGRVRSLFHGHVHRPISALWRGMPISSVPGTNHQVALRLDGSTDVLGEFEAPGYAVALIRDDTVCLHQERVGDAADAVYVMEDPAAAAAATLQDVPLLTPPAAA